MTPERRAEILRQTEERRKLERASGSGTPAPQTTPAKPRIGFSELARKRSNCAERKRQGLPCNEFAQPAKGEAPPAARSSLALVTLNIGGVLHPNSRASMKHAAARWGADFHEITEPLVAAGGRPHWQKSELAEWGRRLGYERVVYYDADVLIRSDCPSPFEVTPSGHVGVVTNDQLDGPLWRPGERNHYRPALVWWADKLGLPIPPLHHHVNSGMIVFEPEVHRELFSRWREAARAVNYGEPTILIDQAAFSVLLDAMHGERHGDSARTFLPMQYNLLIYRHELINAAGPMQSYVYHFTGHRKDKLAETVWAVNGRQARTPPPAPVTPAHPTPSATLLGPDADLSKIFDRIAVINLDRRADRWAKFTAGLPQPWPFAEPQRQRAVDVERCPPPDWFVHDAGQWGCRQSHLRAIEDALNDGLNSLLVFEDDAEFPDGFLEDVQQFLAHVPDDWTVLFLGGTHTQGPGRPVNTLVSQPGYVTLAHAYALRGPALRAVYDHAHRHTPDRAEFDHRLGSYAATLPPGVYCPRHRWLVHQAAGYSDLTLADRPRRGVHSAEDVRGRATHPLVNGGAL